MWGCVVVVVVVVVCEMMIYIAVVEEALLQWKILGGGLMLSDRNIPSYSQRERADCGK